MRWGEPTRLPPLRRGRGLAAAALLTVGLVAAYAILGVLSLTSVAPSFLNGIPTSIGPLGKPGAVPAVTPNLRDLVGAQPGPSLGPSISTLSVPIGRQQSAATFENAILLRNTSAVPVNLSVDVIDAPGVTATFPGSRTTQHLQVNEKTHVAVSTSPLFAGNLHGFVKISMTGAKPLTVPLTGAQAPLPPGAVTATPQAHGAVHLTWPASPSTGVAGYQVERRVPGGPWQTLDASAPAGGITDQNGPDGQTVQYRASAVTAGVQPALLSLPGAPGSAVPDAPGRLRSAG